MRVSKSAQHSNPVKAGNFAVRRCPTRPRSLHKSAAPSLGGVHRQRLRRVGLLVALWAVVALPVAGLTFVHGERETSLAGHDAVVTPAFDSYATLDLGPYLPHLRYPTGGRLGAGIDLGKTQLRSYEVLVDRYATLAAQPEGEVAKVSAAIRDIAVTAAWYGALAGLAGPGLWLLLGERRRTELTRQLTPRNGSLAALGVVVLVTALLRPWQAANEAPQPANEWRTLSAELPDVPIPEQAQGLEVQGGLFTTGSKRLAESLVDTYARSATFYAGLVDAVPTIAPEIRTPEEGETVALLVSDRHDNVRMDAVARAVGDLAGATILLAAGDDTSTGSTWEAFSLDSLDHVFADYEHRFAVTGNHDQGDFVGDYLRDLGFTRFDEGEAADGPDGIRFLGADDPRSSGLGSWRDEVGLSFGEHADRVAERACTYDEEGERISTLLVHDVNTGAPALERGCVDLVVGGHLHERLGPTEVVGTNGRTGYTYTTGTTGGAAYAIAIGSKLRRNAQLTLITYRDGRPVGLQPVTIRTVGDFRVTPYIELDPAPGTTNGPDGDEAP